MGINLFFANDINNLLNIFLKEVNDERHSNKKNAFSPTTIFYPNTNVKKWLQLEMSKKLGIAINLDFQYLEEGLSSLLIDINSNKNIDRNNFLFLGHKKNHIYLQLAILDIILKQDIIKGDNIIKKYFESDGIDNHIIKAWQLSIILAKNFREYEYHRSEMIEKWLEGRLCTKNHQFKEIEKIQSEIYKKIFVEKKYNDKIKEITDNKEIITLPQFVKRYFSTMPPKDKNENPTIFIFGFSQISNFHYELLKKIQPFYKIKIFQFNFYPNLTHDKIFDENMTTNNIIKQWGNPLKENNSILKKLAQDNNNINVFIDNQSDASVAQNDIKVLKALQNSIKGKKIKKIFNNQDESLQIIGCPSAKREIEIIYNNILYNLQNDDTLDLNDIALLVPNISKYKSVIESVFGLNPNKGKDSNNLVKHFIPYNISDSSAKDDSIFANAFLSGLQLTNSNFNRKDVFDFIFNPCVLEARGISYKTALTWLNWADALHIYHSYDQMDNQNESHTNSPWWTWEMGLKRLRFGRIMSTNSDAQDNKDFNSILPFTNMDTESLEILDAFILFTEEFFNLLKKLSISKKSTEWKKNLNTFLHKFLKIPDNLREELFVYNVVISKIEDISLLDLVFNGEKIEFDYIVQYLSSGIEGITSTHGKYLVDGITISSLSPMRPIPFRIVYIIGLNEREFPGDSNKSTLDLRNDERKEGDVSKIEANNYLFLETLLTVKDKLYLSYISQDTQKDKKFYPSSVCVQLINYLEENILENNFNIIEAPLKGESIKYFQESNYMKYSDILNANYFYSDRLLASLTLLKESYDFSDEQIKLIEEHYNNSTMKFNTDNLLNNNSIMEEIEHISINDLKNFILNPFDTKLKKILHIYDKEDLGEKLLKNEEPFLMDSLLGHSIRRNYFLEKIDETFSNTKVSSLESKYKQQILQGNIPEGVFETIEKQKLHKKITNQENDLKNILSSLKNNAIKYYNTIQLTDLSSREKNICKLPPLEININNHNIKIIGSLNNLIITEKDNIKSANFIIVTTSNSHDSYGKKKNLFDEKYSIIPILSFMILDILAQRNKLGNIVYSSDMNKKIIISYADAMSILEYSTPNWTDDDNANYFKYLIVNLFNYSTFEFLPFMAIFDKNIKDVTLTNEERLHYYSSVIDKIKNILSMEYNFTIKNDDFRQMIDVISFVPENALDLAKNIHSPFCNIVEIKEDK